METILDHARLDALAGMRRAEFAAAAPYPHLVIDDFLPEAVARRVEAEFPDPGTGAWTHYHHFNEKKLAITRVEAFPPTARAVIDALQSDRFLSFVSRLTGIEGLLADPDLDGAGLHVIRPGGYLNMHTDFLSHTKRAHWSRQLNLLLYLNSGWEEAWNGNLELWDASMRRCVASIAPAFNRCVIFHTSERSYHGHPLALACPPDRTRKSIALYYFRDEGTALALHPTHYRARPEDGPTKRALIALDRVLLRAYSALKRYTGLNDALIDRVLRRF